MLDELRIGGFKSYGETQSMPLAPLTVFIGANASGKSNFIEGAQLLTWIARSHRLSSLRAALREGDLLARGKLEDLPAIGTRDMSLEAVVDGMILSMTLRVDDSHPRIVAEQLDDPDDASKVPYYRVERPSEKDGAELTIAYNNFSRGRNKPQITGVDDQAVFTQLLSPARFDSSHTDSQEKIPVACRAVTEALEAVLFLDPKPRAMRGYVHVEEDALASDGANVSAVLARLCREEHREAEVLEFIRALPEQDIRSIEFLDGPRGEVMVQVVETFGPSARPVPAELLSDGTLRVLAIAAAILSVPEGTLVVIEEIDNGVHPARAAKLMDALHDASKRRGVRLLVTTHNPALLDAVPLEAIADAVACYRDPDSGGDLEDFAALAARGPLGVVATSGALERFLKHRTSDAERDAQKEQVLALLRSGT